MTRDNAAALGVRTQADLVDPVLERGSELRLGNSVCPRGADCPPGLQTDNLAPMLGLDTTRVDPTEVASALESAVIDVAVTSTTSGILADDDLISLPENRRPGTLCCVADNVVPIATRQLATSGGTELRDVIDAVSAALTTEELIELNRRHDIQEEPPAAIARQWLSDHDLA